MMGIRRSLSRVSKTFGRRRGLTAVSGLLGRASLGAGAIVFFISATAHADRLSGTILDARGNPKSFVLVDVLGPTKVFTQSDSNGRFSVEVNKGNYIIRIRDDRHQAEVEVRVDGTFDGKFQIEW